MGGGEGKKKKEKKGKKKLADDEYSFRNIHRAISFSKACKSAMRSQIVAMRVIFFYELSYRALLI